MIRSTRFFRTVARLFRSAERFFNPFIAEPSNIYRLIRLKPLTGTISVNVPRLAIAVLNNKIKLEMVRQKRLKIV
jgi:hypothetical protein